MFALGSESFEQPDVDVLAAAEVVMHEPARDAGGLCDVLDGDLVVGPVGEEHAGGVQDLIVPLAGVEAAVLPRRGHNASLSLIGGQSIGVSISPTRGEMGKRDGLGLTPRRRCRSRRCGLLRSAVWLAAVLGWSA